MTYSAKWKMRAERGGDSAQCQVGSKVGAGLPAPLIACASEKEQKKEKDKKVKKNKKRKAQKKKKKNKISKKNKKMNSVN